MSDPDSLFAMTPFRQDALVDADRAVFSHDDGEGNRVTRVLVETPFGWPDKLYDYWVPEKLDATVRPGVRVKVPFGSSVLPGYVVDRVGESATSPLRDIRTVVSPVPVLTPQIIKTIDLLAEQFVAPRTDFLRLAIPPRHARAEGAVLEQDPRDNPEATALPTTALAAFEGGSAYARHLAAGNAPRAVLSCTQGISEAVEAAAATRRSRRGVIIVVPTARMVDDVAEALETCLPDERVSRITSDLDASSRYTAFLHTLTGRAHIAVGTRSAAWAPMQNLGLICIIDDLSDHHREQRSPRPHTRDIAVARATVSTAGVLIASPGMSVESAALVDSGWAYHLNRIEPRAQWWPRVIEPRQWGTTSSEFDAEAEFGVVRHGLTSGPVLVVTPRAHDADGDEEHPRPHARRRGVVRLCRDLERAFPGVPVIPSVAQDAAGIIEDLDGDSRIVVATPGAEPKVEGGYAAAAVLEAGAMFGSQRLDAAPQALGRLAHICSLVRSAQSGGVVLLSRNPPVDAVQAIARGEISPWTYRALRERDDIGQPPLHQWWSLDAPLQDQLSRIIAHLRVIADDSEAQLSQSGLTTQLGSLALTGPHRREGGGYRLYLSVPRAEAHQPRAWLRRLMTEISSRDALGVTLQANPTL